MQGSIVFFDGDKGGVGKSVVCGAYADWLMMAEKPVVIVDGDSRNPDVGRIFEGVLPICYANLHLHDGWMDMIDFVHEHHDKTIVISMPAGVGRELKQETTRLNTVANNLSMRLHLVWVINRTLDSVNLLNSALESWAGQLSSKTVIKNLFFGEPDKFRRWEDSRTKTSFVKDGGQVYNFSELHERVMDKLFSDPDKIMPYSSAAAELRDFQNSPHKLTASENIELVTWLEENKHMFGSLSADLQIGTA